MATCKHCGRLIDRFNGPTGVRNWCHVFEDGQPITVYCEFNGEIRAKHGSTMAEPALRVVNAPRC